MHAATTAAFIATIGSVAVAQPFSGPNAEAAAIPVAPPGPYVLGRVGITLSVSAYNYQELIDLL